MAFDAALSDSTKVQHIQAVLTERKAQRHAAQEQLVSFKTSTQSIGKLNGFSTSSLHQPGAVPPGRPPAGASPTPLAVPQGAPARASREEVAC